MAESGIKQLAVDQVVFERYKLEGLIGRGGMGAVWRAVDLELEEPIALKFLGDEFLHDPSALADLKRETRRGMRLAHGNIVRIYGFHNDDSYAAISMELVEGNTLSGLRVSREHGVFTVDEVRDWVGQLCSALQYAHYEGEIVHRDLKPGNLMIDAKGRLKVADFGIAASIAEAQTRVTRIDTTRGTLLYMSPQQLMGERACIAQDIYSLGATLHELLTGQPPFYSGDISLQIREAIPQELNARRKEVTGEDFPEPIPDTWNDVILSCLAKDQASRPQDAADVARQLGLEVAFAPSTGSVSRQPITGGTPSLIAGSASVATGSSSDASQTYRQSGDPKLAETGPVTQPLPPVPAATTGSTATTENKQQRKNLLLPAVIVAAAVVVVGALLFNRNQSSSTTDTPVQIVASGDVPEEKVVAKPEAEAARQTLAEAEAAISEVSVEPTQDETPASTDANSVTSEPATIEESEDLAENSTLLQDIIIVPQLSDFTISEEPLLQESLEVVLDEMISSNTDSEESTEPQEPVARETKETSPDVDLAALLQPLLAQQAESSQGTVSDSDTYPEPNGLPPMPGSRPRSPPGYPPGSTRPDRPESSTPQRSKFTPIAKTVDTMNEFTEEPVFEYSFRIDTLDLDMRWIPGGINFMGGIRSGARADNEERQTYIAISKGYWLSSTEITCRQYDFMMGTSKAPRASSATVPVSNISWDDAMEFCKRLNTAARNNDLLPESYHYSLPTEAQWEYACKEGDPGPHGQFKGTIGNAWAADSKLSQPKPVAQLIGSQWGLYDMLGNVSEWVLDYYEDRHPGGTQVDWQGPENGSKRVVKGGDWTIESSELRASRRADHFQSARERTVGFRLALVPQLNVD